MNISDESMLAITRDRARIEITNHEKCKDLINLKLAVDYFVNDLNFMWNEERQSWCLHYAEGDIMIYDTRTVHEMIDSILADPARSCLFTTKEQAARYVRPKNNPWIRGQWFSLAEQGRVFTYEPEQARKWRDEARKS